MGQVLHGRARTTAEIRREIQQSEESAPVLAKRYNINRKTVYKWRHRETVLDRKAGPTIPRSKVLSSVEEALIVTFRKHTLLPLDDCLFVLKEHIPHLSRSTLHRCFQRHGISRLPTNIESEKPIKQAFKTYPIGYFHIDITKVRTEEGTLHLFVAIDRTSKYAYVELHPRATRLIATAFLKNVIKDVPYQIHTILTDNGVQFTTKKGAQWDASPFDMLCAREKIEHRLTQIAHPWTNGQVERMNRTIKEATIYKYHYESHDQLKRHLHAFILMYNSIKRLKGKTPYEFIVSEWQRDKTLFKKNPNQKKLGLNT